MTRINIAVPPRNLTDQHLLAEHREIKRICSLYKSWKNTEIPANFSLGKGHVLFFLNKGKYTHNRYKQLYLECLRRKFEIENYSKNWEVYKPEHYNDYTPTKEDINIITQRIHDRIVESKQVPRYYGEKTSKIVAIVRLFQGSLIYNI